MTLQRDSQADGAFVYAVVSTGIYCRPTCPSRRPRRTNVRFFSCAAQAESAGFRACRRCRPGETSPRRRLVEQIRGACERLRDEEAEPTLEALAQVAGMSPGHFQKIFKRIVGITPKQYAIACRERRFRELLRADGRVIDAVYTAGYNSSGVAYSASHGALGMTPGRYKQGGKELSVRYCLARTELGWLIVAVTGKGVCGIELGDEPEALREAMQVRFPHARLVEDRSGLAQLLEAVTGFIARPADGLDLPLDIQGTAFQRRVWQALRRIPVGETRSYTEVARQIGKPGGARAVASACAHNALALAIPCHRVVRAGGKPGGYRWGPQRKRKLLDRERE